MKLLVFMSSDSGEADRVLMAVPDAYDDFLAQSGAKVFAKGQPRLVARLDVEDSAELDEYRPFVG